MMSSVAKFLRILRVEKSENAREMSDKLKISPSYLSAIENGKRTLPFSVQEAVISVYELSPKKTEEFKKAVEDSSSVVKVDFVKYETSSRLAKIKKIVFTIAKGDLSEKKIDDVYDLIYKQRG